MTNLSKERAERLDLFRKALAGKVDGKEDKDIKALDLTKTQIKADGAEASEIGFISTGSVVLNRVCGGNGTESGYPRGRVVEIFGPESVGKTTLAIHACREAQKLGGIATFVDFEHALHLGYASQGIGLDLDPDKFQMFQPEYFEQGAAIVDMAARVLRSDVIVVDSVSSMLPKKVLEGSIDADPGQYMGLLARLMSQFLNVITKTIDESQSVLIFVNQVRARIKRDKFDFGPDEDTSGGKALKFYSSIRLQLKPGAVEYANLFNPMLGKEDKTALSNFVRALAIKNKVSVPKRLGEFCLRYGEGIDNVRSILDVAIAHDIIKKGASWYEYKGLSDESSFKQQGTEAIRKFVHEHPEVFAEIAGRVQTELVKYSIDKISGEVDDSKIERVDLADEYDKNAEEKSKRISKQANEEVEAVDDASAVNLVEEMKNEKIPEPKNKKKAKVLSDDEIDEAMA